jgi:hypothetical protein
MIGPAAMNRNMLLEQFGRPRDACPFRHIAAAVVLVLSDELKPRKTYMASKDSPPQGDRIVGPGPPTTGTAADAKDRPHQDANVALAEASRSDAEQSRRLAEEHRQLREHDRETSEMMRQTHEQLRDAAESARAAAEEARLAAEEARLAAEDARHAVVDSVRTTSETLRMTLKQMNKIEEMRRALLNLRDTANPDSK